VDAAPLPDLSEPLLDRAETGGDGAAVTAAAPVLELVGIAKRFGGVTALDGVDFKLGAGEIHGLVGENGAGKSTLMKIIAGVHTEFAGELRLDGRPRRFAGTRDARDAGIAMVHQELSIVPYLSVAENFFLGRQPTDALGRVRWRAMAQEAGERLRNLGIELDPTRLAGELPLGLQQLIEIGRVLFSGARIVILDEPTSALSAPEVARLFGVLRRLKAEGTSFVFISHFIDDILEISDTVTIFRNSRRVLTAAASAIDKGRIIELMIGRGHEELESSFKDAIRLPPRAGGAPALTVRGLACRGAFAEVALEVHPGEVLGLYGFMGCGALEVTKALVGKLRAEAGEVHIAGRPVRLTGTAAAKRAGLALVPESRRAMLFAEMPVYQNISIAFLERIARLVLRPAVERRIGQAQVERFGIRPRSALPPVRALSGGNQQKVALARWLVHRPRVLLLAEPTRGMDVGAKDDVVHIIQRLKSEGLAVVVASTEPETILQLADRVLVMRRGRITREFAGETVSKDTLLAAA
jgi:ribose transport system ATP-binding protein